MEQDKPHIELYSQTMSITKANKKVKREVFKIMEKCYVGGEIQKMSNTIVNIKIIGRIENLTKAALGICELLKSPCELSQTKKIDDQEINQFLILKKTDPKISSGKSSSGHSGKYLMINTYHEEKAYESFADYLKRAKKFCEEYPYASAIVDFASLTKYNKRFSEISVTEKSENQPKNLDLKTAAFFEEQMKELRTFYEEKLSKV